MPPTPADSSPVDRGVPANAASRENVDLRYRDLTLISRGATADVYRAYDSWAAFTVALKVLRRDDPATVQRALQEARALSQIDHPAVCRIHDFGTRDGRPYIAMDLIEGMSLDLGAAVMPVEIQAQLMAEVARGVHAAHLRGIIHRDLKPANIMVNRGDDGQPQPVVIDFGLALDAVADQDASEAGQLLGTPAFMAPEQLRGQLAQLDARTDVYALGATLYALLADRPPFDFAAGRLTVEQLKTLLEDEPPPLAQHAIDVPPALATIVHRCLARRPTDRYPSAAALADDLEAFVRNEPLAARRPTTVQQILHTIRRRPRAWQLLPIAGLLVALTIGFVQHHLDRVRSAQQHYLRLGGDLDAVQRVRRMSAMHDIAATQDDMRQRIGALHDALDAVPRDAQDAVYYALGRAHLALGDAGRAAQALQQAWDRDLQTAEVAYALGLALGETYRVARMRALDLPTASQREATLAHIDARIRAKALYYLARGRDAEAAYVEALIALYETRYDDALAHLDVVAAQTPWRYEHHLLRGDVRSWQGDGLHHDQAWDEARARYREADQAYRDAIASAPSDILGYLGRCHVAGRLLRLVGAVNGSEAEARTHRRDARTACAQARVVDSSSARPMLLEARHALLWGQFEYWRLQRDPLTSMRDAERLGREALDQLDALARLDRARPAERAEALHRLGRIAHERATLVDWVLHRSDPRPQLDLAIVRMWRALDHAESRQTILADLGSSYRMRANYEVIYGADERRSLRAAVRILQTTLAIAPDNPSAHFLIGDTYHQLAMAQERRGARYGATAARADDHFERAHSAAHPDPWTLGPQSTAALLQAKYARATGQDPSSAWRRARDRADAAVAHEPTVVGFRFSRIHADLYGAWLLIERRLHPEPGQTRGRAVALRLANAADDLATAAAARTDTADAITGRTVFQLNHALLQLQWQLTGDARPDAARMRLVRRQLADAIDRADGAQHVGAVRLNALLWAALAAYAQDGTAAPWAARLEQALDDFDHALISNAPTVWRGALRWLEALDCGASPAPASASPAAAAHRPWREALAKTPWAAADIGAWHSALASLPRRGCGSSSPHQP